MAALLAGSLPAWEIILIVALCVVAVASLVYGAFKKFSRMSWAGWQIVILYFLSCLFVFVQGDGWLYFLFAAGGFLLVAAGIMGAGALIRRSIRNRGALPLGMRVFDRILGAFTALFDWAVFFAVVGGFVLAVFENCVTPPAVIASLLGNSVIKFMLGHAVDAVLIVFFVYVLKAGYRLGFLKSLWTALGIAFTFAAFAGSLVLTLRVPFFSSLAQKLAACFGGMNGILATVLGYGIMTLICFVVMFVVIALLFALLNMLRRKINRSTVFNAIDGCVLAFIMYAFAVVFVCGIDFAAGAVTTVGAGEASEALAAVGAKMEALFTSSPMSSIFYYFNPIRILAGG